MDQAASICQGSRPSYEELEEMLLCSREQVAGLTVELEQRTAEAREVRALACSGNSPPLVGNLPNVAAECMLILVLRPSPAQPAPGRLLLRNTATRASAVRS